MIRPNDWQGVDHTVSPQSKNNQRDDEAADFDLDAIARALGRQSFPTDLGRLSEPETGLNLTYGAVLGLAREDALTLGVPGCTAEANRQRGLLAQDILLEWTERSEGASRAAVRPSEPDVPQPFGMSRLALAGGDVRSVIDDLDFANAVLRDLGHGPHARLVSDEDGERYVFVDPSSDDLLKSAREVTRIRGVVADRGVLSVPSGKLANVLQVGGNNSLPSRPVREARRGNHTNLDGLGPGYSPF